jgi:riboflavin synthase alpha subunit
MLERCTGRFVQQSPIEVTTLRHLSAGSHVNLEIDVVARDVERMMSATLANVC